MNLACLLMTLVCLTTILLFSGNQSGSTSGTVTKQQQQQQQSFGKLSGHDEPISESIDSADSQPLVSPPKAPQVLGSQAANADFDDFSLMDERRDSTTKFRRKSSETSDGPKVQNSEHEVEELTTTGANSNDLTPAADKAGQQPDSPAAPSSLFPLIDPILSQILNDMELGSLFKSIKRSSNATGSGSFLKPIIRRSKNGATIIISSGSFNESSLNDSSLALPSLIEKLLPPGLRPLSLGRLSSLESSSNGTSPLGASGIGTATITIGAEPIFAASSSPLSSGRLGLPPPPFAAMDPFGFSSGHHIHERFSPSSLFMEPMMGFRFPSPFVGSSFGQPPPGLLSVLMRQAAQADADDEPSTLAGPRSSSHFLSPLGKFMGSSIMSHHSSDQTTGKQSEQSKSSSNETNSNVQASQNSTQTQATKPMANPLKSAESAPGMAIANESGGASPPKSRDQHKMQNLYSSSWKKPQAGSMLIFSSGQPEPPARDPFQLSPFSMLPMPQMMMLGGSSEPQTISGNSPLNPILRTILNSVRSDLEERNKTERAQQAGSQRTSGSSVAPHWSSLASSTAAEMDDEWNGNQSDTDRWDEQNGAKQMRARHRSADDEPDTTSMEGSDFVSNFQLDQANNDLLLRGPDRSPLESGGGIVSGTIRQTIRGPGMTVERIIEVPSSRFQQAQQAGIGSQSLSSLASPQSADMIDEMGDYMGPSRMTGSSPSMGLNSLFSRSASDRMSSGGSGFEDFPMPHVGFIGRLLSDMSKHVSANAARDFQMGISRGGSGPTIKNRSLEEELDEGDSNESFKMEGEREKWPADDSRSKAERWRKKIESSRAKWGPDSDWYRKTHEGRRRKQMSEDEFGSASPSQSEAVFVQPSHLIIPENFNVDQQDKEINLMPPHLFNGSGESSKLVAGSFDDTMNSMENRMNHVLSMASHNPFPGLSVKPIGAEEQAVDRTSGNKSAERMAAQPVAPTRSIAPSNNMIYLSEIGRMDPKQATSGLNVPHKFQPHNQYQPQQAQKLIQQVENPFTSPSSPLFGFPTSSVASGINSQPVTKDEKNKMNPSGAVPAIASNRKQRSFTYHSNNELASSIAQKQQLQQQQQQREQLGTSESIGRPRFMAPFDAQPASIIMGRRLDDRPNPSESMQMMDHPFGEPASAAFDGRNLINHHTGSFAGSSSNQAAENYRTIVI